MWLIKDAVDEKAINACKTQEMTQFYKEVNSKCKIQKEFEKSVNETKKSEKENDPATSKNGKKIIILNKINRFCSIYD